MNAKPGYEQWIGVPFGTMVVEDVERMPSGPQMRTMAYCRCSCGSMPKWFSLAVLKKYKQKSCGCKTREQIADSRRTHGMRYSKEYRTWVSMKQRCCSPTHQAYAGYGGRGISVCKRWLDSFESFYADMGPCPDKTSSLDRINNDGNYEPDNCRWIPKREQTRNTRFSRRIEYGGRNMILSDWARLFGVHPSTVSRNIDHAGLEAAMTRFFTRASLTSAQLTIL